MHWIDDYLKAIKEYARDYVLENTGLKVLALLITGVLWLSVASRPVSQVAMNGAIEFNLPESHAVSKYDTLNARVYLEGPRDTLDALRAGQLTVTADMSDVEPGVRVIALKVDPSRLPANVRVKEIEPPTITVTVERVVEKEVPVSPRWEGAPPSGYELMDWVITPPTVKIAGAESQMKELTRVSTETVRLTDKISSFAEKVAIDIGSPNYTITEDSSRKVMLQATIEETRKVRVIENIPVAVSSAPSRARPIPRSVSVTLYGARSAIDEITISDVSVSVEYQPGSRTFTPIVTLSPTFVDRVAVRSIEPKTISIR
ncbi:MAG TPA: CdaR family protein [Blastocatellia bacterium]|nr:CdaR family protein [Blastocatellia bacterium]